MEERKTRGTKMVAAGTASRKGFQSGFLEKGVNARSVSKERYQPNIASQTSITLSTDISLRTQKQLSKEDIERKKKQPA